MAERRVTINGGPPHEPAFTQLETMLGGAIADGDYWYDAACGACGTVGGPTQGFLPAGLDLAGPLPADASGGGTGLVINGRELHPLDVAMLNQILIRAGAQCLPGRWALDAAGNLGPEGAMPWVNLVALQAMGGGAGGGDNFWSSRYGAGNEAGGSGYVRIPGGFVTY